MTLLIDEGPGNAEALASDSSGSRRSVDARQANTVHYEFRVTVRTRHGKRPIERFGRDGNAAIDYAEDMADVLALADDLLVVAVEARTGPGHEWATEYAWVHLTLADPGYLVDRVVDSLDYGAVMALSRNVCVGCVRTIIRVAITPTTVPGCVVAFHADTCPGIPT